MAKGKPTITKPAQKPKPPPQAKPAEEKTLADCRRARHDYFILETLTAGMVLQGWEVKSARAGRAQINESYVIVSRAEVFLLGSHFSPLTTTSTHTEADPARSRKLLLNAKEIDRLQGKTKQAGLTIVPLRMLMAALFVPVLIVAIAFCHFVILRFFGLPRFWLGNDDFGAGLSAKVRISLRGRLRLSGFGLVFGVPRFRRLLFRLRPPL